MFQTRVIRREMFLQNSKLTSIGVASHLNKTFFTHFDTDHVRINCFFYSEQEAAVSFLIFKL